MLWCVRDLELAKYITLQPFEETRQKLHKPSCFIFSYGLMLYYLIFHLPNFLIAPIKASVRYFSLFLKDKCISSLFWTKYNEKKFNLQLFFSHRFMNIHSRLSYHGLPLLKTSCFQKWTACVIETMLMG